MEGIMTVEFKCDRCGEVIVGSDEYDAEVKFDEHSCKGKRELSELPLHILKDLAMGKITEKEAWERAKLSK